MQYLDHSGIKGQRKGVRRYQYANKTYTPAGNERYRPKKGNTFTNAVIIGGSAAYIGAMATTDIGAAVSSILSVPITKVAADVIGAGAAVAAGLASIPLPVIALGVPIGAIATASVIKSGMDYLEDLKRDY